MLWYEHWVAILICEFCSSCFLVMEFSFLHAKQREKEHKRHEGGGWGGGGVGFFKI
jgi:hypothetical protein